MPFASRCAGLARRLRLAAVAAVAVLAVATCTDSPIEPGRPGLGRLRLAPRFDAFARLAPLTLDNVRVIVVRPPSDTLADVARPFSVNSGQLTLTLPVPLQSASEDLEVTLELYAGPTLLFRGTQTITVTQGVNPPTDSIPLAYQGPGATIASITIGPRDTTVGFGAVVNFGATAQDSQQAPVAQFYVGWTASAGSINGAGQFTAPAARDTVTITATAPSGIGDQTTVIVAAPPATLVKVSGDPQTGLIGTRLPLPLVVRVDGSDGLPVSGVAVTWAATTGGGSVDSANTTTDALGIAQMGATLGSTAGPQTFTASATGLSSAVFNETATTPVGGSVWNGSVSTAWTTAGNWTPALVPGLADDVTVPAGPANQPVVSTTANLNNLTIAPGASVTLAGSFTFNIAGNLAASGDLVVSTGTPTIQLSGTAKTLAGSVASATITGTVALAGNTTVGGNVGISGGTAQLSVGNSALQVGGGFSTGSGGRLVMTTAGGQLDIAGSAAFGGGNETGLLTAGSITIGGDFSQTGSGSPTSFAPSGTHLTGFTGAAATHIVNFGTPGAGAAGSHFNALDVSNTGTVSLATDVSVDGQFSSTPSATPPTLATTGATHRLTAAGVNVTGLAVNQATLAIGAGTIVGFNNVQFSNSPTTAAQLTVNHPGAATPFTFNNLSFGTTPVAPNGFYLDANDSNGATGGVLTITMTNPTPATPGAFFRTTGGAVINWPAGTPTFTWTGAVSTDWSTAGNWSGGLVPTSADDVTIPGGTPTNPVVTSSCSARSILVNSLGSLNLGSFNCQVQGNVFSDGTIIGSGAIQILAAGQVRGNFPNLTIAAPVTVNAATGITGSLTITGPGTRFVLNGQVVSLGGNFATIGGARLVMLNPADALGIGGNALFDGGFELDSLTAGLITIGGNFTQAASTSGDSYHPSGSHVTVLTGASPTVTFATPGDVPGTSHFQELAWSGGGTLQLGSAMFAHGSFSVSTAAGFQAAAPRRLQVGNLLTGGPLTFTNVLLGIQQALPVPVVLQNLTFQGVPPESTQVIVRHPGLSAASLAWSGLSFSVTPTTGFYLRAEDNLPSDGVPLVVNISGSSPASGGAFVQAVSGATVNWPAAAAVRTWAGTISTDWFTAGNWVGGVAPTSTDNVVIPAGTPFGATIGATTTVNDLTVQSGAVLGLNDVNINVTGNLDATGAVAGCCGDFIALSGGTLRGNFDQVVLSVSPGEVVSLNGATVLSNSTVQLSGELILAGNSLDVGQGSVSTVSGAGRLTMTNPADQVIAGLMDFSGGDETGRLTAGVIHTQSLNQGGTVPTSFLAGGNHLVVLGGPSSSAVTFATPASSRFQELDVSGVSATLTLGSNVTVAGQLISLPSGNGPTITGTGVTLTAGGADVVAPSGSTALIFNGVPLVLSGGTIAAFSRVTFQNQNPIGTALTVNNVGQAAAFLFGELTFTTGLSAGGFHLVANDLDGPTPNPLTVNVLASTPASGAGVSQANPPAVINWPPTGSTFTWDGSASQDWFDPANWDLNAVPTAIDNVILVPITNQPLLSDNAAVNDLTSTSGSILDLQGFGLAANGNVDLAGSITDGVGGGGVSLTGSGMLVRGTMNTEVVVVGSYTLNGNFIVSGNLSVQGSLALETFTAQVGGSFTTLNTGVLAMTVAGSLLDIAGDAIFAGGSTNGLLTAGTMQVAGAFNQIGINSAQSFAADPGHLTVIAMLGNPATVTFTTPGGVGFSHFGNLSEDFFGATITLNSDVTILGTLSGGDGFGGTMVGTNCPTVLTLTGYSTSGPLNLDCVQLVVDDPAGTNTGFNGVTFTNLPTDVTQLTVRHPGLVSGSLDFSNTVTFVDLTTGATGFYLEAIDTDGAATADLSVAVSSTNVTNGPSFQVAVPPVTIIWP